MERHGLQRVVIAAGGTGGHLYPALAVAEQLREEQPATKITFVGSRQGLETTVIPDHGFELVTLETGRLKGTGFGTRVRTLARLPLAVRRAISVLRELRPDVVVGAGGYVSAPIALAAALRRRPLVLLEQNALPGLTNRVLSRIATRTVIAFEAAAARLPAGRTALLGNPVRPSLLGALGGAPRHRVRRNQILVLGGSQGAHRLNELLTEAAPTLDRQLERFRIIHQTGEADQRWVADRYRDAGVEARVSPFITDMASAYRAADLVISRSGATTLAELTIAGLPALLVPYPHAADDHQTANAEQLQRSGAAITLPQGDLSAERLAKLVRELFDDPDRLKAMSAAMRVAAHPDATADVVALLRELATVG